MYEPNVSRILSMLTPSDAVLDIGGWACPFNRANYILDAEPYESRGYYRTFGGSPSQGGDEECFTKDTWIQRDICDKEPFPFKDKQFDFVICSQTLEDVRDPLYVCAEIVRIGKRGYIEIPSRLHETCRGWESNRIAGLSHHRWLVEIEDRHIQFLMKYHMIHEWRLSFPPSFARKLTEEQKIQWLFWDESFTFSETTRHGLDKIEAEMQSFIENNSPHSNIASAIDRQRRRVNQLGQRVMNKFIYRNNL